MTRTSKRLFIVEGPDGAGKTTLARALVAATGAHYVHLGPFPRVEHGLARLYADALMPAVLGVADVVMDRSWLSERPYGAAFRGGADRLGGATRTLERLAWRCATLVVRCFPPWERVLENFGKAVSRTATSHRAEMLDTTAELSTVYAIYAQFQTSLPMLTVDPFAAALRHLLDRVLRCPASVPHDLAVPSAGNLRGKVTIIGQQFAEHDDSDHLYRWPFGGLSRDGCSLWLADHLEEAKVSERDLLWINADALTPAIKEHRAPVVAFGGVAARRLTELGRPPERSVRHPAHHRRDYDGEPYILGDVLRELIDD